MCGEVIVYRSRSPEESRESPLTFVNSQAQLSTQVQQIAHSKVRHVFIFPRSQGQETNKNTGLPGRWGAERQRLRNSPDVRLHSYEFGIIHGSLAYSPVDD